jgi:hypothetical protein
VGEENLQVPGGFRANDRRKKCSGWFAQEDRMQGLSADLIDSDRDICVRMQSVRKDICKEGNGLMCLEHP